MAVALASIGLLASSGLYPGALAQVTDVPNPASLALSSPPADTLLYDRTGTVLLADLHPPGYQRYPIPLADMGRLLPEATIDIEDASFWQESGIDVLAILRAAIVDLEQHRVVEGGSTITQQLVKLRAVGSSQTFTRKLREAVLAAEVAQTYSHDQVLQMYLNSIYYGNDAYGAEAAARNFFHVDAGHLDLAQASLLAGLPDNANLYNPFSDWAATKARQLQVLDAMVRNDTITRLQANAAYAEDLRPPVHMFLASTVNLAPGFVSWVSAELAARFGTAAVTEGGLHVTTTLDWRLQQEGQNAISGHVSADARFHMTDGALAALDPRTGQVLAMVGSAGPNAPGGDYNFAVWPPRNTGSSFKIFNYTAAIASKRFTMVTPIRDAPIEVLLPGAAPYAPRNYDGRFHGICQLQQCLGNSLNVPAVQVEMVNEVPTVVQMARTMGAPPYVPQPDGSYSADVPLADYGPSLTLGGYGETPLQMATGAAVLADQGVLHQPTGLISVTAENGKKLFSPSLAGQTVVDPGVAYVMSQILSNNANREMTFGWRNPLAFPGRHVAAKTGTSDNFTDGWTVGYTPSLAAAVWTGNANFQPMAWGFDSIFSAAPAWHQFMQSALDTLGKGDEWYQTPPDVYARYFDGQLDYFLAGTSPSSPAPPLPPTVRYTWVAPSRAKPAKS